MPYRSSRRSSRSRCSRGTGAVAGGEQVDGGQQHLPFALAAARRAARSASQSAAVSRPASVVSASSPTTGTTSETTRRSTFAWSRGQRLGDRPRVGAAAGELVDLVEQAERVDRVAGQPRRHRPERLQRLHVVLADRLGEHVDDRLGAGQRPRRVGVEVVVDRRLVEQEPPGAGADRGVRAEHRPGRVDDGQVAQVVAGEGDVDVGDLAARARRAAAGSSRPRPAAG